MAFVTAAVILCMVTGIGGMYFMHQCTNEQSESIVMNNLNGVNTAHVVVKGEYTLINASYEAVTEIFEPRAYGDITISDYEKQGTNIILSVENIGTEGYVLLPLLNYKGYRISSENNIITNQNLTTGEGAVMQINIPSGYSGQITVKYQGFWYWRVGELISVASVGYLTWRVRKSKTQKDKQV